MNSKMIFISFMAVPNRICCTKILSRPTMLFVSHHPFNTGLLQNRCSFRPASGETLSRFSSLICPSLFCLYILFDIGRCNISTAECSMCTEEYVRTRGKIHSLNLLGTCMTVWCSCTLGFFCLCFLVHTKVFIE